MPLTSDNGFLLHQVVRLAVAQQQQYQEYLIGAAAPADCSSFRVVDRAVTIKHAVKILMLLLSELGSMLCTHQLSVSLLSGRTVHDLV